MTARAAARLVSRTWFLWLLAALVAFAGCAEKQTNIIPGAGPVDASGMPARAADGMGGGGEPGAGKQVLLAGAARGGGRGGGGGGMAGMPAGVARSVAFEAQPVSAVVTSNLPRPSGPMLIRTADLRLRVEDVAKAHEEVARIARAAHGYIAQTTYSSENGPAAASVTLRVPGEGMDSAVDRIAALGKLLNKEIGAQEVTEEYVDLSSRKRNLEREEQRLLELLQRAGKMRDLLEVESTLARVRGEIEQIAGRMRYLENRVSLSTIHVQLSGPEPEVSVGGPVWTASDVSRTAVRSLIDTGRGLATIGIWLGVYSPVWIPIALLLIWLVRKTSPRPAASEARPSSGS